jgi:hypothetical protein
MKNMLENLGPKLLKSVLGVAFYEYFIHFIWILITPKIVSLMPLNLV